jgi:hypothetical protein
VPVSTTIIKGYGILTVYINEFESSTIIEVTKFYVELMSPSYVADCFDFVVG